MNTFSIISIDKMYMKLLFLVILSSVGCEIIEEDDEFVTLETKNGVVRGTKLVTDDDNYYYAFRSIPFAEPPIGKLRFEPPVKRRPWPKVLDATSDSPYCLITAMSSFMLGQEDCLYLSVYTPQRQDENDKELLSVIVYISGGFFQIGGSDIRSVNPDYFMDHNVVFVAFNFRLNLLGFASLGKSLPANIGLMDQLMVLEWIKENIESFGGDPDKVTLLGRDGGAASIGYLLQSQSANNLFHKVIMQSGSPISRWALSNYAVEGTKWIGDFLNISYGGNLHKLAEELRKVGYKSLQEAVSLASKRFSKEGGFVFAPSLETEGFIKESPLKIFSDGNFYKVPIIIGYTAFEAFTSMDAKQEEKVVQFNKHPDSLVPSDMNISDKKERLIIGKIIKAYFANPLFREITQLGYYRYVTDDVFAKSICKFAKLTSKYTPTYFYKFSYEGGPCGERKLRIVNGAKHNEEIPFLFKREVILSPKDLRFKDKFIELWINFAKEDVPLYEDKNEQKVTWPQVTNDSFNYLDLDEEFVVKKNPSDSFEFWNNLYQKYARPPFISF